MNTFNRVALEVRNNLSNHLATTEKNSEWQRVNSYVADVLKDAHVLYAKLARLQGDFIGTELEELEKISENVLDIGGKLSSFSKAFYEGKLKMSEEGVYGEEHTNDGAPTSTDSFRSESEPSEEHEEHEEHEEAPGPDGGDGGDVDVEFDYESQDPGQKKEKKPKKD